MDDTATTGPATDPEVAIDEEFGRLLVQAFNDLQAMPVHLLFNQWWSHAPQPVTRAYVEAFLADAGPAVEGPGGAIADPVDLDAAGRLPEGTLGRRYHDWIVENGLQATIAMDYRGLHDMLVRAGMLDGMPEVMQQAVLRGFQVHDFQHVLTGYDPSGLGEIALQSFCLAQIRFPYFSMWMSVITSRMTFVDPTIITAIMDGVTDGWTHGRSTRCLAFEPWESMLDEPLADLRDRYGVDTTARPGTVFAP
jgi:ubiquinone biosynthesis protein Coq4